jgi:pimeloyl-ACP methyl ester carboxylesterase
MFDSIPFANRPVDFSDALSTPPAAGDNCPPGSHFPLLPGIHSRMVQTPRLFQHIYERGSAHAEPLILIHGNASSARFYETLMLVLASYYVVAPDMRGYGASEAKVVDATRGVRDYADDLHALVETLGIERFHLVGWSLGGNIAIQYLIDHPDRVLSLTLLASGSPYGYGGTHGPDGVPNYDDFAGSGAGLVSPQVYAHYAAGDTTAASPFSPRSILRQFYVKPSFHLTRKREDALVEQMLMMTIGGAYYPGDSVSSPNWPFVAPGVYGPNNAVSPKYLNQRCLGEIENGPPILWIRGADDQVVSDASPLDLAVLGKLGILPGWPGDRVYPPQPMLAQLRAVLDQYASRGGCYQEEVLMNCGHSPHIERLAACSTLLTEFLRAARPARVAVAMPATPAMSAPPAEGKSWLRRFIDFVLRRK